MDEAIATETVDMGSIPNRIKSNMCKDQSNIERLEFEIVYLVTYKKIFDTGAFTQDTM